MFNNMDSAQRDVYNLYQEPALNCDIKLQNQELWKQFSDLETEMIITKSGRRMFPALRVQLEHLDANAQYCVLVEMIPVSKCRYKYSSSGGWAPAGAEEAQSPNRIYLHPESPAPGHHWMSQAVSFGRLKLTNTANPPPGHVVLSSMHRYQPRIIVVKTGDPRRIAWAPNRSASFPETVFIAVTAYQNDKITKLKIDNNPFAKGFRENGQSKCKRKRQHVEADKEIDVQIEVDDMIEQELKRVPSEASYRVQSEASVSPRLDVSDSSSDRTASSPESVYSQSTRNNGLSADHYPYNATPYQYRYPILPMDMYSYYLPQYNMYPPNLFYPYSVAALPQDLSVHKIEAPKKLTDFSIRAITGLS